MPQKIQSSKSHAEKLDNRLRTYILKVGTIFITKICLKYAQFHYEMSLCDLVLILIRFSCLNLYFIISIFKKINFYSRNQYLYVII